VNSWFPAFALTMAIEVPIYIALLRPWVSVVRGCLLAVLVNLVTHPVLWFSLVSIEGSPRTELVAFVIAEALVWLVECALLWLFIRKRGAGVMRLAVVSAVPNLTSQIAGLLIAVLS
jgi:hypothetical protein